MNKAYPHFRAAIRAAGKNYRERSRVTGIPEGTLRDWAAKSPPPRIEQLASTQAGIAMFMALVQDIASQSTDIQP